MTQDISKSGALPRIDHVLVKLPWVLATLLVLGLGFWSHMSRHLNLSSDEIYFYYSSHYPQIAQSGYHETMVNRLLEKAPEIEAKLTAGNESLGGIGDAKFYLAKQLNSFGDYPISHMFWGLFSDKAESMEALPPVMAQSIVSFLVASGFFTLAVIALVFAGPASYRFAKIAFFTSLTLFIVQEVLFGRGIFLLRGVDVDEGVRGVFLRYLDSELKDFLAFSFSPRSNFLLMLIPFFGLRWGGSWIGSYAFLAFAAAWHSSHGFVLLLFAIGLDLLFNRHRMLRLEVLGFILVALWFSLMGNMVPAGPRLVLVALVSLVLVAVAVLRGLWVWRMPAFLSGMVARRAEWTYVARSDGDTLVFGLGCLALLAATPLLQGLMTPQTSWTIVTVLGRLGCMAAVAVPLFIVATLIREDASAESPKMMWTRLGRDSALAAMLLFVAAASINLNQLQSPKGLMVRLEAQAAGIAARNEQPATFVNVTEMERLWYSIVLSSTLQQDRLLRLD